MRSVPDQGVHMHIPCASSELWMYRESIFIPSTFMCYNQGMLETERLVLRPWTKADADVLFTYSKDPVLGPRAGWAMHKSIDEGRRILMAVLLDNEAYAIELKGKKGNTVIGCISIKKEKESTLTHSDKEVEISYWIANKFWNKGYATEAVKEILRHAFDDEGMEAVWGAYFEGNDQGRRVLEKCGFSYSHMLLGKKHSEYWDTNKEHVMEIMKSTYLNLVGRADTQSYTFLLSKRAIEAFSSLGGDWQQKINDVLIEAAEKEIEKTK